MLPVKERTSTSPMGTGSPTNQTSAATYVRYARAIPEK